MVFFASASSHRVVMMGIWGGGEDTADTEIKVPRPPELSKVLFFNSPPPEFSFNIKCVV